MPFIEINPNDTDSNSPNSSSLMDSIRENLEFLHQELLEIEPDTSSSIPVASLEDFNRQSVPVNDSVETFSGDVIERPPASAGDFVIDFPTRIPRNPSFRAKIQEIEPSNVEDLDFELFAKETVSLAVESLAWKLPFRRASNITKNLRLPYSSITYSGGTINQRTHSQYTGSDAWNLSVEWWGLAGGRAGSGWDYFIKISDSETVDSALMAAGDARFGATTVRLLAYDADKKIATIRSVGPLTITRLDQSMPEFGVYLREINLAAEPNSDFEVGGRLNYSFSNRSSNVSLTSRIVRINRNGSNSSIIATSLQVEMTSNHFNNILAVRTGKWTVNFSTLSTENRAAMNGVGTARANVEIITSHGLYRGASVSGPRLNQYMLEDVAVQAHGSYTIDTNQGVYPHLTKFDVAPADFALIQQGTDYIAFEGSGSNNIVRARIGSTIFIDRVLDTSANIVNFINTNIVLTLETASRSIRAGHYVTVEGYGSTNGSTTGIPGKLRNQLLEVVAVNGNNVTISTAGLITQFRGNLIYGGPTNVASSRNVLQAATERPGDSQPSTLNGSLRITGIYEKITDRTTRQSFSSTSENFKNISTIEGAFNQSISYRGSLSNTPIETLSIRFFKAPMNIKDFSIELS